MIDVISKVPSMLVGAVPDVARLIGGGLGGGGLPGAVAPPAVDEWFGVAESVARHWTGDSGGAAASSLLRAATGAATLDGHATGIDGAAAEGFGSIASAGVDMAMLAADFMAKSAATMSTSMAAGPAGPAMAMAGIQGHAAATMAAAMERLARLDGELAGPTASLEQVRNAVVDLPTAPTPPGGGGPSPVTPQSPAPMNPASMGATPLGPTPPSAGAGTRAGAGNGPVEGAAGTSSSGGGDGAPTPQAQAAVRHALSAVGTPYQWGGNTPGVGLDCSGLTNWAYGQAGVDIPRTAAEQAVGRQVGADELLPGDLVVWDGHVAMVIGDGQMVEAGDPVQTNPIRTSNMNMGFMGFWRPTG